MNSYYKNTTGNKIILNDLDYFNMDDIEMANNMLMTIYNSDVISTIPTCEMGCSKGRYLLGKTCRECGTTIVDPQKQLEPVMWLKTLSNDMVFVNPHYWYMLRMLFNKNIDYVRWLCDTSYNPPGEVPPYIHAIKEIIGERDYNSLWNNLDKVLLYMLNQAKFKDHESQTSINILLDMYNNQKENIFSDYLPIVNKKLFVMENTTKGKFTNLAVSDMIDLIMIWIKASSDSLSPRRRSNLTATIISKITSLYKTYTADYVAGKIGIFRKHVYSARSHFTFRAVITSIPGPHDYSEIHVPWAIGVTAFRPHLLNKLIKLGYSYKKASDMLFRSVHLYSDLLHRLLNELITDAKDGKLYVLIQRN